MPDAGAVVINVGSIDWLNKWVGHARPGARQMIGPVAMTHLVSEGLGKRVQALVGAGLLIAVWKAVPNAKPEERWEWRLVRTGRELPAAWPLLVAPRQTSAAGAKLTVAPKSRLPPREVLFELIKGAALAGRPSPSNDELCSAADMANLDAVREVVRHLDRDGLIVVRREKGLRVFSIPALGVQTEGAKA